MTGRMISFAVTIVALASYHLTQKAMPDGVRPAALFAFIYGTAAIGLLSVVAFGDSSVGTFHDVIRSGTHWAPWLLAASVAGIEIGYFAMYRSGWSISTGSIAVQAVVALVLVVCGIVFFRDHLTLTRTVGVACCVVGAAMVAR